jgi:putative membrane protein
MVSATVLLGHSGWGDHMDHWGGGDGWWVVMVVLMVVFWGAVIVAAVWAARSFLARGESKSDAIELLERRLASGEISPEEYRERRDILMGHRGDGESG